MNALEPGATLGSYRILARLRAGAMGVLYLARRHDPSSRGGGFNRPVAIKVIHDHLSQNKRFVRMFIDEAKVSAFIDDPNVVRVEEFGQDAGRYFLVMEYVDGASLAQALGVLRKRGRIPIEQAVAIAMQIAGGLHGAHEATDERGQPLGIVHRDVSPHNVLVSWKGYVRVIDFGIAKAQQVGGQTKTGSLRGKLAYMPPEQARSARTVDRRADLYGVGLVLWEMLTFRRVFDADTDIAILNQIRDPKIDPPSRLAPNIPPALDDVVMRMLANEPNDRPANGAILQRALAEAVPAALLVLPGDLAALMKKVRAAADAAAAGDDDAALYGNELKQNDATFAGNMHESVSQTEAAIDEDEKTAALLAPPAAPPPRVQALPAPATTGIELGGAATERAGFVAEDETTMRREAPVRPSGQVSTTQKNLRPSDGVRAIAPSSPDFANVRHTQRTSSANLLGHIPTPPPMTPHPNVSTRTASMSSVLVPPPQTSTTNLSPNQSAPGVAASGPPPGGPTLAQRLSALPHNQKMALALGVPITMGVIVAIAIMASGSGDAKPSIQVLPQRPKASVAAPPSTPLQAPVVIAPPPTEYEADAATSRVSGKSRPSGGR